MLLDERAARLNSYFQNHRHSIPEDEGVYERADKVCSECRTLSIGKMPWHGATSNQRPLLTSVPYESSARLRPGACLRRESHGESARRN